MGEAQPCLCEATRPLLPPLTPLSLSTESWVISFFLSFSELIVCHKGSISTYWLINLSIVIEHANVMWR